MTRSLLLAGIGAATLLSGALCACGTMDADDPATVTVTASPNGPEPKDEPKNRPTHKPTRSKHRPCPTGEGDDVPIPCPSVRTSPPVSPTITEPRPTLTSPATPDTPPPPDPDPEPPPSDPDPEPPPTTSGP
ncbi:hypothetical protein GCM10010412_083000 [Nonomuraea recticatena]|uniref:Uncharacterized protein n=1 Tax=Nonomuraea recticatena TaxID=46178 RepID=A0ABP6FJN0_9ACTN